MGTIDLKGPHAFIPDLLPPEVPPEEVETIIRHLADKLPGETLERLDSTGSLKEKLRGFMNRHYRTMIVHYLATDIYNETEPAMRRTSGEIVQLLHSMGGAGLFPTGEIERPLDAMRELETHTNKLLSQEAGSPLLGDNVYSVVKCVFRDNARRPATVTDVKLVIIIPDAELISPLFHYGAVSAYLIKDLIARQLIESIDREIAAAGQAAERQNLEERITGLLSGEEPSGLNPAGLNQDKFDSQAIRGQIMKSADFEHVRGRGFNAAVNALVSMLGNAEMDYQFLENRNGRELIIREYEDADPAGLPDERYQIRLKYFDEEQLIAERAAYDARITNFENAVQHLWNLIAVLYQDSKSIFKVHDFEDLAQKNKSRIREFAKKTGEPPGDSAVEIDVTGIRAQLVKMRERIQKMYESLFPVERRVLEERLSLLEKEYARCEDLINPHHLQPGLLIDIDITSIKRKKTSLDSMAGVLNQFLREALGAFHDAASAVFAVPPPARQPPEKGRRKKS